MTTPLPNTYYLDNFVELIDYVLDQYEDLLTPEDIDFHLDFHCLSEDAQKLFVRMLMRKGDIFRCTRLNYAEITDTRAAAEQLATLGFIDIDPAISLNAILPLYRRDEWLSIIESNSLPCSKAVTRMKRTVLDDYLRSLITTVWHGLNLPDTVFQLKKSDIFAKYCLLFFGNREQDLTEFILRDLGLYCYERYCVDKSIRYFQSLRQIDEHMTYYRQREALEDALKHDADSLVTFYRSLPNADRLDDTLQRRMRRIYYHIARQLERLDRLQEALEIYQHCHLPEARQRMARVLVKLERSEEALTHCEDIKKAPMNEEERVFAEQFGRRLANKLGVPWQYCETHRVICHHLTLPLSDQRVEHAVAEHLNTGGTCFYVENALHCSVFGLHYWDVIFAPVRGAFTHPFQHAPLDLYDESFCAKRQNDIALADKRLTNLTAFRNAVLTQWRNKLNTMSPFVFWRTLNEDQLTLALERIPLDHWKNIFQRLWSDLRANRAGFPDLVFFPKAGGYEFIEVKGPGDHLQKNQQRWMRFFDQHEMPHQVINVEWQ